MTTNVERLSNSDHAFVQEKRDDATIVHVHGEIDLASAAELEEAIAAATDAGNGIIIDLAPCSYIDSSILAVLIRTFRRYPDRLSIVLPQSGSIVRLFEVTSLSAILPVIPALPEID